MYNSQGILNMTVKKGQKWYNRFQGREVTIVEVKDNHVSYMVKDSKYNNGKSEVRTIDKETFHWTYQDQPRNP